MSTIDTLVSSDLAMLGRETRGHVPALDAMMPDEAVRRENATLLELASTYAKSAASAAWGGTALVVVVSALVLIVSSAVQAPVYGRGLPWPRWIDWFSFEDRKNPIWVFVLALACSDVARRRAVARFATLVSAAPDPIGLGRRLVQRMEPWRIALRTAGIASFGVVFCVIIAFQFEAVVGAPPYDWLFRQHSYFIVMTQWHTHEIGRLRDLCIAVSSIVVSSIWIARRRPRFLRSRLLGWGALGVAVVAAAAAFRLGAPADDYHGGFMPAFEHTRTLVTAIGALGLFVAVASSSLRRSSAE